MLVGPVVVAELVAEVVGGAGAASSDSGPDCERCVSQKTRPPTARIARAPPPSIAIRARPPVCGRDRDEGNSNGSGAGGRSRSPITGRAEGSGSRSRPERSSSAADLLADAPLQLAPPQPAPHDDPKVANGSTVGSGSVSSVSASAVSPCPAIGTEPVLREGPGSNGDGPLIRAPSRRSLPRCDPSYFASVGCQGPATRRARRYSRVVGVAISHAASTGSCPQTFVRTWESCR